MSEIKIVLSSTNSIGAKFLKWHQRSEWAHVEVEYDNYFIGARTSGVDKFDLDTVPEKHIVGILKCTRGQKARFDEFIHSQIGKKYDWKAYVGFLFNKKSEQEQHRWFCSELILAACDYAGIQLFNKNSVRPWNVMPRDIHMARQIEYRS
jgi:uncharacterized protein YycO